MRTLARVLVCSLVAFAVACGGGGGGGPAPAGGGAPALAPGVGSANLVIPFGGVLASEVVVTTDAGLRLTLPAGTWIRTSLGAHVQGPVTIGIDDAGGAAAWTGVPDLIGVARVYVLLGPAGSEVPIAATFEPPGLLEAPLTAEDGGAFAVHTWVDADGACHIGAEPGGVPDLTGFMPVDAGMAGSVDNSDTAVFPVANTCVLGATFVPPGTDPLIPPDPKPVVGGSPFMTTHLYEMELPADAVDVPVKAVQVINPRTAQIVKTFNADGDGWDENEGEGFSDGSVTWTVVVVNRDGKRFVQVRTNYKNDFVIEVTLCDRGEQPKETISVGATDETDTDAEYVGGIKLDIRGWGGFRDFIGVRGTIHGIRGTPFSQATRWFFAYPEGGRYVACIEFFDYEQSTQTLAALFPPEWTVTPGNRYIKIEIPCPPPTIACTTFTPPSEFVPVGNGALHLLDPATLQPQQSFPLPPQPPLGSFVLPGGQGALVALPDQMLPFEFPAPPVPPPPIPIPGLGPAFGVTPTQQQLIVPLPSQELLVIDLATGQVSWQQPFPVTGGPFNFTDVAVAPDGSRAYVGAQGGHLFPVDLLRQDILPPIPMIGADRLGVAPDSLQLAAADLANGGIRLLDPATNTVSGLIATGPQPVQAIYAPDGTAVVVPHQGTESVVFVDPQTQATSDLQLNSPLVLGIALFPDLGGTPQGLAIFGGLNQGQLFPLNPAGMPDLPLPLPPDPRLVGTNGQ